MTCFSRYVSLAALLTLPATALTAAEPVAAVLQIPRAGVTPLQEVEGQLKQPGYPVLLVKADLPEARWWVQDHAVLSGDGKFRVRARFGNEKTRPGTKFKAVVLLLGTDSQRELWQPGDVVKELPLDLRRSKEETAIIREDKSKVKIIEDVFANLRPNSEVERIHQVSGKLEEHYPVLLVRSAEPNSPWWVQPPVKFDSKTKRFIGKVVIGNSKTRTGARFRVVALALERYSDLRKYREGLKLTKLSPAIPRSEEVTLIYRPADAVAADDQDAVIDLDAVAE